MALPVPIIVSRFNYFLQVTHKTLSEPIDYNLKTKPFSNRFLKSHLIDVRSIFNFFQKYIRFMICIPSKLQLENEKCRIGADEDISIFKHPLYSSRRSRVRHDIKLYNTS